MEFLKSTDRKMKEGALEALGTKELGQALADVTREASLEGPSKESLDILHAHFEAVSKRWDHQASWPVHADHRQEIDALLRDTALVLGKHGYLG